MSRFERLRLAAAAALCAGYLAMFGYCLFADRDGAWPVSIYPMYSGSRAGGEPVDFLRVAGVQADGERLLREEPPLDESRLRVALRRLTGAQQREALEFLRDRHPEFSSVRLYRETWSAGGATLMKRELLLEVAR